MPTKTKGHWPKNKRRNPDGGRWSALRLGLQHLLENHRLPGVRSREALAATIGVSGRSVGRWLSGVDVPKSESQDLIEAWLSDQKS